MNLLAMNFPRICFFWWREEMDGIVSVLFIVKNTEQVP